jgi:hypothetical protein
LTVSGMLTNDPAMSTQLVAGFGIHPVVWEGETLFVCYQRVGHVVGTYSDAVLMEEFCVYANGLKKQDLLHRFCEHVYNEANKNEDNDTFRIYSWVIEEGWWKTSSVRSKRPMESVVLPDTTKETILNDLDSFLDDKTETWYRKHGIVYKRSCKKKKRGFVPCFSLFDRFIRSSLRSSWDWKDVVSVRNCVQIRSKFVLFASRAP